MSEHPLHRLGGKSPAGATFFEPHHLVAAQRVEMLMRRAQLSPRLTMSYEGRLTGKGDGRVGASDMSDTAADARHRLNALATTIPADCWGVVLDVCCFGKGVQDIEAERGWPRRSAKLVLRIGLDHLATQFGLAPHRAGGSFGKVSGWLSERLPIVPDAGS
jgi:hypothetical protein